MYTLPHLVYLFIDGHLGCFYRLAFVNNAVINLSVQISLQDLVLSVLDEFPEVELLNLKIVLFLIFKGNSMLFSI